MASPVGPVDVVDLLLVLLHPFHIFGQRGQLAGLGPGGFKAQQFGKLFAVGKVLGRPFFQENAEGLPEGGVFLRLLFGLLAEVFQKTLGHHFVDFGDQGIVLQGLARDIERQILAVDHPFHKAQPLRQDILAVLLDQHPLAIKVNARVHPAEAVFLEILLRHKEQGLDRQRRIGFEMQPVERVGNGVADKLVKFVVLLFFDLVLAAGPQGLDGVDRLARDLDREGDEAGILLDDLLDPLLAGKLLGIAFEFDDDLGAAVQPRRRTQGIAAGRFRGPFVTLGIALVGTGLDPDLLGHHEGGVEADPELADELDVLFGRLGQAR